MKTAWVILTVLTLGLAHAVAFADEIQVPFAVRMTDFKAECKTRGMDLDEVDGFITDRGQDFSVFTYETSDQTDWDLIREAAFKTKR